MNKVVISVFFSIFLIVLLSFSGFFKTTGFAVDDQKLLVSLDIPPEQQSIKPGESLLLEVDMRVPGGTIDQTSTVELEYSIKDLDGNLISAKKESGAVAVKESTVTSLLVPTTTKPGVYTASVLVTYEGEVYEGSKTFEVTGSRYNIRTIMYVALGIIVLVLIFFIIKKIRNRYI